MKNIVLDINGKEYKVDILRVGEFDADLRINKRSYKVNIKDLGNMKEIQETTPAIPTERTNYAKASAPISAVSSTNKPKPSGNIKEIIAPLPGIILDIKVKIGDEIKAGQTVLIMEAMKMENEIPSEINGVVKDVKFKKDDAVLEGDVLIELV